MLVHGQNGNKNLFTLVLERYDLWNGFYWVLIAKNSYVSTDTNIGDITLREFSNNSEVVDI